MISRKWEADLPRIVTEIEMYTKLYLLNVSDFSSKVSFNENSWICKWANLHTWIVNKKAMSKVSFIGSDMLSVPLFFMDFQQIIKF